jgi:hypothetical protein
MRVNVWKGTILLCLTAFFSTQAFCWEGDVHYGLTYWLAVQAGFNEPDAKVIAEGDFKADSGNIQYVAPLLYYACMDKDSTAFQRAGAVHYPTNHNVPAEPALRVVVAGSAAASSLVDKVISQANAGKSKFMLQRFGAALNTFQDSWSNQGVSDTLQSDILKLHCDERRTWAHPKARGGWASHEADLTSRWPDDVRNMASATYAKLLSYPATGYARHAVAWLSVSDSVTEFARLTTKTQKARWFIAHGLQDVSFLEGVTLRDGDDPFLLRWNGRSFPNIPPSQIAQPNIDAELLSFYHLFFTTWLTTSDFEALVNRFGPRRLSGGAALASLLMGWRIRDHSAVADILHSSTPPTREQQAKIKAIARRPQSLSDYPFDTAYIPFLPDTGTKDVSPLLPYIVKYVDGTSNRAVAIIKLRYLPYDLLAISSEFENGSWHVTNVLSAVDH